MSSLKVKSKVSLLLQDHLGIGVYRTPRFAKHPHSGYGFEINSYRLMCYLYDSINNVDGNIVECGVGQGRSFLTLADLVYRETGQRILWGFDSFEGFPEPSIEDQSERNPKKGEWNLSSPDTIRALLIERGGITKSFIDDKFILIPGFFQESLVEYDHTTPIAFLHLDVDLYNSYKITLESLFPHVASGGVVLFDEYKHHHWPGATKAIDEYLSGRGLPIRFDRCSGRHYIIKY